MADFFAQYPPVSGGTTTNASVGVNGDPAPASSTQVAGENPSGDLQPLQTNASGDLLVEINAETSGLATAANQVLEIADLDDINTSTDSLNSKTVVVDTSSVTIIASALPTGAATETTLSNISSDTTTIIANTASIDSNTFTTATNTGATNTSVTDLSDKSASADVVEQYDYRSFTYVGATQKIDTITYKFGGSGGTTVATQTFGYDGSDRLTSITKT